MGTETRIKEATILLTGGTGSLGQAIVEYLVKQNPEQKVRIYSRGEHLQAEMRQHFPNLRYIIGDIREYDKIYRAMNQTDYVIHCAALKRVEVCEENPSEAISTNVNGTENVIGAALNRGIQKVLAISSDKAVHPINLYGTTKLVMEKLILQANGYVDSKFSVFRSGNFFASRGSVIPLWERQYQEKGEISITDGDMTRYWITLEGAAEFAVRCLRMMEGGEIFIPRMKLAEMREIAKTMFPDAKIKFIGKRSGERAHEMIIAEGEEEILQDKGDYYLIKP